MERQQAVPYGHQPQSMRMCDQNSSGPFPVPFEPMDRSLPMHPAGSFAPCQPCQPGGPQMIPKPSVEQLLGCPLMPAPIASAAMPVVAEECPRYPGFCPPSAGSDVGSDMLATAPKVLMDLGGNLVMGSFVPCGMVTDSNPKNANAAVNVPNGFGSYEAMGSSMTLIPGPVNMAPTMNMTNFGGDLSLMENSQPSNVCMAGNPNNQAGVHGMMQACMTNGGTPSTPDSIHNAGVLTLNGEVGACTSTASSPGTPDVVPVRLEKALCSTQPPSEPLLRGGSYEYEDSVYDSDDEYQQQVQ